MNNFIKKKLLFFSYEPFVFSIFPVFYLMLKNYMAFIHNEDMSFDLMVLILKDGFVKLLIILLDLLVILAIFYNVEYRIKRSKSFLIESFSARNRVAKDSDVKITDELNFVKLLKADIAWNDIRFKMVCKADFVFDKSLVDYVSNVTFRKHEFDRIPLIIIDENKLTSDFMNNLFLGDNVYVALLLRVPCLNDKLNFSLTICRYEYFAFKELKSFYNV